MAIVEIKLTGADDATTARLAFRLAMLLEIDGFRVVKSSNDIAVFDAAQHLDALREPFGDVGTEVSKAVRDRLAGLGTPREPSLHERGRRVGVEIVETLAGDQEARAFSSPPKYPNSSSYADKLRGRGPLDPPRYDGVCGEVPSAVQRAWDHFDKTPAAIRPEPVAPLMPRPEDNKD